MLLPQWGRTKSRSVERIAALKRAPTSIEDGQDSVLCGMNSLGTGSGFGPPRHGDRSRPRRGRVAARPVHLTQSAHLAKVGATDAQNLCPRDCFGRCERRCVLS